MKTFTITARQNGEVMERLENVVAEKAVYILRRWSRNEYTLTKRLEELLITDSVMFCEDDTFFTIRLEK